MVELSPHATRRLTAPYSRSACRAINGTLRRKHDANTARSQRAMSTRMRLAGIDRERCRRPAAGTPDARLDNDQVAVHVEACDLHGRRNERSGARIGPVKK